MTDTLPTVQLPAEFKVRLDFYWQSVALYAIVLIAYAVLRAVLESTLQEGRVGVVLSDPVVVLMSAFVCISAIGLTVNKIARRSIIVSDEGITFASRFHERTYHVDEVERIALGRDRRIKVRGMFSIVKIRIKGRRRPLRIRPALYDNENNLVAALLGLRKHLHRAHE